MRYGRTLTVLTAAIGLCVWASAATAQVYAGESEPGWIVGYDGALGTIVNPDAAIPGVHGMTIDEFGRLLIAVSGDQGEVLLFDIDAQVLDCIEYDETGFSTDDVYPDPADSNIYVIKNGSPHDGGPPAPIRNR